MKQTKKYNVLLLSFVLITILSCSKQQSENPVEPIDKKVTVKEWTYLFYNAIDNPNMGDASWAMEQLMKSNDNLNIVMLRDRYLEPTEYFFMNDSSKFTRIKTLDDLNSGSAKTLADFIGFVKNNFPAKRYMIAFVGSGGGWSGTSADNTDALTGVDIRTAFENANFKADLIMYTGACVMASYEIAYELSNVADILVASESPSHFGWWYGPWEDLCKEVKINPGLSNDQLAKNIIRSVETKHVIWDTCSWVERYSMSAIKTKTLQASAKYLDTLALNYLNSSDFLKKSLKDKTYSPLCASDEYQLDVVDLIDLLQFIERSDPNSITKKTAESAKSIIKNSIVDECHGKTWAGFNGINIRFAKYYFSFPNYAELLFSKQTNWEKMLIKLN